MISKKMEKTIKEIFEKLIYYSESFFLNMYNYYVNGIGYGITKYQKKTEYRIQNLIEKTILILGKENVEQIKREFLHFSFLIKKKDILRNKDWLKNWVLIYSHNLQDIYAKEFLYQIENRKLDVNEAKKKIFNNLNDSRWDFEKTLTKTFPNKTYICLEKSVTCKKKKWKKTKKF